MYTEIVYTRSICAQICIYIQLARMAWLNCVTEGIIVIAVIVLLLLLLLLLLFCG